MGLTQGGLGRLVHGVLFSDRTYHTVGRTVREAEHDSGEGRRM